ncbi:MAG: malate dehydrogenase [Candidatus Omnitrophica bacterium]|nr:malate dehydrogenase [Candidatus Omnitrophota bacterium]
MAMAANNNDKVSIVGAGNVGAMLAQRLLEHDLSDVVLVDIDEGLSRGKACDLQDASPIIGCEKEVIGTSDYSIIEGSDIVVITAGLPRKPGMTREDLIQKNAAIIRDVASQVRKFAPQSIVIVVTNPLDIMAFLAYKLLGFEANKVLGMAGVLDSARCSNIAAEELGIARTEIDSVVIGSHDTNMVPLLRFSQAQGTALDSILDNEKKASLTEKVKRRGAEIVSLLKSGSAFFAPSAACFSMIKSILKNEHLTQCASVLLNGEYGLRDIFIGVPVVLGRTGIEKIIELELTRKEREKLKNAADAIKKSVISLNIQP